MVFIVVERGAASILVRRTAYVLKDGGVRATLAQTKRANQHRRLATSMMIVTGITDASTAGAS